MNNNSKFWPLDDDPEGEIYDNPSWDLPGFRDRKVKRRPRVGQRKHELSW